MHERVLDRMKMCLPLHSLPNTPQRARRLASEQEALVPPDADCCAVPRCSGRCKTRPGSARSACVGRAALVIVPAASSLIPAGHSSKAGYGVHLRVAKGIPQPRRDAAIVPDVLSTTSRRVGTEPLSCARPDWHGRSRDLAWFGVYHGLGFAINSASCAIDLAPRTSAFWVSLHQQPPSAS